MNCPECDAVLDIPADVMLGEILVCEECSLELEVIRTSPLRVEPAPEVEEDWGE